MAIKYVNNWDSNILAPVLATDTVFTIPIADSLLLPPLAVGDYILLTVPVITLSHSTSSWEIIKVTAVDTTTGYLTVVRAQEGTVTGGYSAGQNLSMRLTAAEINTINTSLASQLAQIIKKIETIGAGSGITVDITDPLNPIVSAIPVSAAGLLNRIIGTADATTLSSGTYYLAKSGDKGTTALATQTVAVDDNQKAYFAQDFVTDSAPSSSIYYAGIYSGSLSVACDTSTELVKYTVEVYLADVNGNVIDSGITTEVVGNLGVKPLTVLTTGNIYLQTPNRTNEIISGTLSQNAHIVAGQRIRFHISGEKVGITGGIFTLSFFSGSDVNSYVDVPVVVKTSSVLNDSNVVGSTALDALNSLKTSIDLYTAANVLSKLLTVDGVGSGLDADLFQGRNPTSFADVAGLATQQFDALAATGPTQVVNLEQLIDGTGIYALDTGTTNHYKVALSGAPTTLKAGMSFRIKTITTNTDACDIQLNTLPITAITNEDGTPLYAGQVIAGGMYQVVYNGTSFILSGSGGGGATAGGVIYENGQTISANYTLSNNKNGMSVGPISIASGVSVTTPTGSRWVIL
jgi:hypothetical protein